MKTWKKLHLEFLDLFYKKEAEAWKEEHDDRRLFSNTYYHLREAILSLDDEPHVAVKVAMNRYIDLEYAMLDEIKNTFEEMGVKVK